MDCCGNERPLCLLRVSGGEGGIRTPDTRKGMPDFESGAFNRALPPLRIFTCFISYISSPALLASLCSNGPGVRLGIPSVAKQHLTIRCRSLLFEGRDWEQA